MSQDDITTERQLATVERVIEAMRWVRDDPKHPEYVTLQAFRAIARDLRARLPDRPERVRRHLGRRIATAIRGKTSDDSTGFQEGHLIGVATELIGAWPTVEQALERMERELQKEGSGGLPLRNAGDSLRAGEIPDPRR